MTALLLACSRRSDSRGDTLFTRHSRVFSRRSPTVRTPGQATLLPTNKLFEEYFKCPRIHALSKINILLWYLIWITKSTNLRKPQYSELHWSPSSTHASLFVAPSCKRSERHSPSIGDHHAGFGSSKCKLRRLKKTKQELQWNMSTIWNSNRELC